jgi:hypothetical protein
LPEFLYADLYDEKHRTLQITKDEEETLQKGLRQYLLCQKCETKLSKYEKYAKGLLQEIPNFSHDESLGILYSNNVDYSKFKLFQLSILWRSGISNHKAFNQVRLGSHEEKLRRMLVEDNPGKKSDYGCIMSIILKTELLHKIIQAPTRFKKRLYGHNGYKFVTGNLTWVFIVSSHPPSQTMQECFLQESGLLRVLISRRDEQLEIMKIGRIFQEWK